jgi:FkbM family methyltransferase
MMRILPYVARAKLYLTIAGLVGLVQVFIAKLTKTGALVQVKRADCRFPFYLRFPASDTYAFEQIFINGDYEFTITVEPTVIVDVGANIGLAAIYFANRYPRARIIALEPEKNNFALLRQNVAHYTNIIPVQAALWHKNTELPLLDPGRGEWGFTTWHTAEAPHVRTDHQAETCHTVRAITVDQLMADYALGRINILKIDIEGAEKEVFSATTAWIDQVDTVIIELHEFLRPGCNDSFYQGAPGFDHEWQQGENIILTKGNRLTKN